MNLIEQGLIVGDLNAARSNARLAESHLDAAKDLARLQGLNLVPLNLATEHFKAARAQLDIALGNDKAPQGQDAPEHLSASEAENDPAQNGSDVTRMEVQPAPPSAQDIPSEPQLSNPNAQ